MERYTSPAQALRFTQMFCPVAGQVRYWGKNTGMDDMHMYVAIWQAWGCLCTDAHFSGLIILGPLDNILPGAMG